MATVTINPPDAVSSVPVVPGLPLIGNLLAFRRDRLALQDQAAKVGPIARVSLVHIPIYVVTCADLAHTVLVDDASAYHKSPALQFLVPLLGQGLLTAEDAPHKRHRKLLAPAFAPKRLAAYGEVMVDETIAQLARWRPGDAIDLSTEMMELTLAIAGKTMFSADVRGDAGNVSKGLELAMRSMVANITSPVRLGYDWPLPRHLRMKRGVKLLDEVVYRVIAEGRKLGGDRGDVLAMLLMAQDDDGTRLTDAQIRDEVMTLILAGHETTANALTWTWYELGRNPGVLAKLEAEIAVAIGDRRVTVEDLPKLPWNLAVIEESMRLHPPVYMTGREAQRDVTVGDHALPKGSMLAVYIRAIHRRADYFPQPLAFRPERMLAETKKLRPRHHYLPFGAGPRVCIGSHFALLEAQLILATMVQRAKLRLLSNHVVPEPMVTLRPRGGMPARVEQC
ncbi:MAG: cytochrome P450 [Kofleriaceae bacterium]